MIILDNLVTERWILRLSKFYEIVTLSVINTIVLQMNFTMFMSYAPRKEKI